MFEREPEPKVKPLRAVEQWALDWLRSVPFEQRTVAGLAQRMDWSPADAHEVFERLLYWKLIS